jgi:hypothetical protein
LAISIAEVDHQDKLQLATFGVAVVSADAAVCEELLGRVSSLAASLPDAILADRASEMIPFGRGGQGVRGGIEQEGRAWLERDDDDGDE